MAVRHDSLERRLEMKREHNNDYIEWLKSLGCVIYAPMHQEDTNNHINNSQITPYATGSMTWDVNEQMWLFKNTESQPGTTSGYFAKYYLGGTASTTNFTVLGTIKSFANNTYTTAFDFLPTRYGTVLESTYSTTVKSAYAFRIKNGVSLQERYKNGVLVFSIPYSSIMTFTYDTIRIGCSDAYGTLPAKFYLKDFYFFNTALDLSTIRKIQGYE